MSVFFDGAFYLAVVIRNLDFLAGCKKISQFTDALGRNRIGQKLVEPNLK
jgi:hypothetical protein